MNLHTNEIYEIVKKTERVESNRECTLYLSYSDRSAGFVLIDVSKREYEAFDIGDTIEVCVSRIIDDVEIKNMVAPK
jgi:uncharacterized protein YkuJ